MNDKIVSVGVSIPAPILDRSKIAAKERGLTFSAFITSLLARELGIELDALPKRGGDRSKFKTPETHARTCRQMRARQAAKRNGEEPPLSKSEREAIARIVSAETERILLERNEERIRKLLGENNDETSDEASHSS